MTDNVRPLRFELEQEELIPTEQSPKQPASQNAAIGVLLLALKTLSQRVLLAFTKLFTLITVGGAFWLWMSIPEPNTNQLVSLGMFGVFVIVINAIVLRRLP